MPFGLQNSINAGRLHETGRLHPPTIDLADTSQPVRSAVRRASLSARGKNVYANSSSHAQLRCYNALSRWQA